MRNVSTPKKPTKKVTPSPVICVALDAVMDEAGATNRGVANALGNVTEVTVGRWRKITEPPFEVLAKIEDIIGRPRGTTGRRAGLVVDAVAEDLAEKIETDDGLTPQYQRFISRNYRDALQASAEERAEHASKRKTRS